MEEKVKINKESFLEKIKRLNANKNQPNIKEKNIKKKEVPKSLVKASQKEELKSLPRGEPNKEQRENTDRDRIDSNDEKRNSLCIALYQSNELDINNEINSERTRCNTEKKIEKKAVNNKIKNINNNKCYNNNIDNYNDYKNDNNKNNIKLLSGEESFT